MALIWTCKYKIIKLFDIQQPARHTVFAKLLLCQICSTGHRIVELPVRMNISIDRRKMRLIEGNAKCCHLKILTCKGTLRQVFIWLRPRTPYPPPPAYTLFTYILYTNSHREGGEGEPERRLDGQHFISKLCQKYQYDGLYLQTDEHLPRSPLKLLQVSSIEEDRLQICNLFLVFLLITFL